MIALHGITIQNFLSIGNVTQAISFSDQQLVLVLGNNLDLGGEDSRNGAGKSAILNALYYCFYGDALSKIKKDNLINKVNAKQMLVTVEFSVGGVLYRIERGRKPNICKLFSNGNVVAGDDENESQGESRHTQAKITELIGMSKEMMKQICLLNTSTEAFLSMNTANQTALIEELFGITVLSEKANILRDDIKLSKDSVKQEGFRIKAVTDANARIQENIEGIKSKSASWEMRHKVIMATQVKELEKLLEVDIDKELGDHQWNIERTTLVNAQNVLIDEASRTMKELNPLENRERAVLKKAVDSQLIGECPVCHQPLADDEAHDKVLSDLSDERANLILQIDEKKEHLKEVEKGLENLEVPALTRKTFYNTLQAAYEHKGQIDILGDKLQTEQDKENPYLDQITSLTEDGLEVIDRTELEEMISLRDHQEFLLKLLASKESFIRKRIIEQNIAMLNTRLKHYIGEMGLQHGVKFLSDLSAEISLLGNYYDVDNLSRGEKTRLSLSLAWSFRDIFEGQHGKLNLMFIDEVLDNGLDSSGVDSAMAVLKHMARHDGRNIFLISHRESLTGRVDKILTVQKENGFTTFSEK